MGIPIEIPPFLDVVLTLSAMLALFAYVYRLAGKEGPPEAGLDEIKRMTSDATVTPHEHGARHERHADNPIATNGSLLRWMSGKIKLYQAAKRKR
jgi:hypothetical protein